MERKRAPEEPLYVTGQGGRKEETTRIGQRC